MKKKILISAVLTGIILNLVVSGTALSALPTDTKNNNFSTSATTGSSANKRLEQYANRYSSHKLLFSINESRRSDWRVGESIKLHVKTPNQCQMQAVLLDANGVATLIDLGKVSGSQEFPKGANFMRIDPPLGQDNLYLSCSQNVPSLEDIDVPHKENVIESRHVDKFVSAYIAKMELNSSELTTQHLRFNVKGRSDEIALTAEDIVDFYVARSRTISRPKLPLRVNFDFGSAQIMPADAVMLDEMAVAMKHNKMMGAHFELEGHTDDIGTEKNNLDLSSRRARAVKAYLARKHSVDDDRIETVPFGESMPKQPNTSDEARAENRRVEFKLIQGF